MKVDFVQLTLSCLGVVSAVVGLFFSPDGVVPCRTWFLPVFCLGLLLLSGFLLVVRTLV